MKKRKNYLNKKRVDIFFLIALLFFSFAYFLFSNFITSKKYLTESKASIITRTTLPKSFNPIINGNIAPKNKYPYFVKVNGICGGALISDRYILTAAHCVYNIYKYGGDLSVLIGVNDYYGNFNGQYLDIVSQNSIFIQPEYEKYLENLPKGQESYDIALLRLKRRADGVPTLSLPPFSTSDKYPESKRMGEDTVIIGLGNAGNSGQLKHLVEGTSTISYSKEYENLKSQIYLFSESNTGTCQGDSGGPSILNIKEKLYVIGIARAAFCGFGKSYYTSTSFHLSWIWKTTGIWPNSGTSTPDTTVYPVQHMLANCSDQKMFNSCVSTKYKDVCAWDSILNECVQLPL